MDAPLSADPVSTSPETQSIAGGASTFSDDEPTAVTAYRSLAAEADAWRAEFEQRATEQDQVGSLMASLARGTREWGR